MHIQQQQTVAAAPRQPPQPLRPDIVGCHNKDYKNVIHNVVFNQYISLKAGSELI
jgi:hypothetical protein